MSGATAPLVSIVMAARNEVAFIGDAIESVLGQIYRNWELLIIDDGSTDETVEIANMYYWLVYSLVASTATLVYHKHQRGL